jgi:hypothetical protein
MAVSCSITPKAIFETTINPASVAAGADGTDQTFTVTGFGLTASDFIIVAMPSLEADLVVCNAHVSANDTIKIRFCNQSAGAIDPASQTIKVIVF